MLYMPVDSGTGGIGSGTGGVGSGTGGVPSGPRPVAFGVNAGAAPDPNMRRTELEALHPLMRSAVIELDAKFASEGIPFRVFEAYRSPVRQAWLYAQGRTREGSKVTNAKAWESYHQYGLAVDFVLRIGNQWSWDTSGTLKRHWQRLHEFGREVGLETLSWELPHLQVARLKLSELQRGVYPDGGDDSWWDNVEAAVVGWHGSPAAPVLTSLRPAFPK